MSVLCTHQAGYIEYSSHGDNFVGKQLRMLALTVMQKSPGVRTEDGLSQRQWEQKKLYILQPSEWGGESEVRLLVIGIGRENCCHHWIRGFIHLCMKISYVTLLQF